MTKRHTDIDVWHADPDAALPADSRSVLQTLLGDEERNRYAALRNMSAKRQYLLAHVLLRMLASRRLGIPAGDIMIGRHAGGKPRIAVPCGRTVDFSISHTEGLVACALMFDGVVGIDVEYRDRSIDTLRIASACLSGDEQAHLASLGPAAARDAFFDLWTVKEAYLKGKGTGLGASPRDVTVDAASLREGHILVNDRIDPANGPWKFRPLVLGPRHAGMLAFRAAGGRVPEITVRPIRVTAGRTAEEILGLAGDEEEEAGTYRAGMRRSPGAMHVC